MTVGLLYAHEHICLCFSRGGRSDDVRLSCTQGLPDGSRFRVERDYAACPCPYATTAGAERLNP